MQNIQILGGCFCGSVRYRISTLLRGLCYCHCQSCRRATGALCVPWGTVDGSSFEITAGELAINASSEGVRRGFCAGCGTAITYANVQRPAEIDITLVSLDDPSRAEPSAHIWCCDKLPWVTIDDRLPQYERLPDVEPS